jgi:hypothetical protein
MISLLSVNYCWVGPVTINEMANNDGRSIVAPGIHQHRLVGEGSATITGDG